ncbi:MAG: AAA family ATPase [Alphaproteobacteria bacterium]|nr:AAA family ATPase [Alphaproteobacteria bacterium]
MKFNEAFYCDQKLEGKQFSANPPGDLDVSRLGQGKPCYSNMSESAVKKPKTLIFADWLVCRWYEWEKIHARKVLQQWMDQGGEVLCWQSDGSGASLVPLTKESLDRYHRNVQFESPNVLIDRAYETYGLARDQIHILDNYWLQNWNAGNELPPYQIDSRLQRLPEYVRGKVSDYIDSYYPKSHTCSVSRLSEIKGEEEERGNRLPNITHIDKILTKEVLNRFDEHHYTMVRQIDISPKQFKKIPEAQFYSFLKKLTNLECLTVGERSANVKINGRQLKTILECIPKQAAIYLSNVVAISEMESLKDLPLQQLKSLKIYDHDITAQQLEAILKNARELEKLSITFCQKLGNGHLIDLPLQQLKSLKIYDSNITARQLEAILKNTSELEKLEISYCQKLVGIHLKDISFPQFKSLNISDICKDVQQLEAFLINATNLEELCIANCKKMGNGYLKDLPLQQLKSLIIYESSITSQQLEAILKNTRELKKIEITECSKLVESDLKDLCLPQLETLVMNEVRLSAQQFWAFLMNAQNLKLLTLTGLEMSGDLQDIWLPHLEKLVISGSNITAQQLGEIIRNATNLKELEIQDCFCLEEFHLKDLQLRQLKSLKINGSNITAKQLKAILSNATNLEELSIVNCKDLGEGHLKNLCLRHLEKLVINNSHITIQQLEAVLIKATRLKSLSILNCSNLGKGHLKDLPLQQLENVNISGSNISDQQSRAVLKNATKLNTLVNNNHDTQPSDPQHDTSDYSHFTPYDKNQLFQFKGDNETLNQAMVIEKLSQYMVLKNRNVDKIPLIQNGICRALSQYFNDHPNKIIKQLKSIRDWDGQAKTISGTLSVVADKLLSYIDDYQLSSVGLSSETPYYLGSCIESFLEVRVEADQLVKMFFENPWHRISCIKLQNSLSGENLWLVYDPNYIKGYKYFENTKDVLDAINKSLGDLVFAIADRDTTFPPHCIPTDITIPNVDDFIRDGGLFVLCKARSTDANRLCSMLKDYSLEPSSFRGLLLRATDGRPAWFLGLMHNNESVKALTERYLLQFIKVNKQAIKELEKSYEYTLSNGGKPVLEILQQLQSAKEHKQEIKESKRGISLLEKPLLEAKKESAKGPSLLQAFSQAKKTEKKRVAKAQKKAQKAAELAKRTAYYKDKLAQKVNDKPAVSLSSYCEQLLTPHKRKKNNTLRRKIAVEAKSASDIYALQLALEQQCIKQKRPLFFANSPDDLVCSAPFIKRLDDMQGKIVNPPAGRLVEFLETHKNSNPVIIINYDNFKADEIIQFNSILDNKRMVDGYAVPEDTLVLGLINAGNPSTYRGGDFYGRFDSKKRCPLTKEQLADNVLHIENNLWQSTSDNAKKHPPYIINLFNAHDWKQRLLGQWQIQGNKLIFKEGVLMEALASNRFIELHNAPSQDPEFRHFWQQARLRGFIAHDGRQITLPPSLGIGFQKGYDWESLHACISTESHAVDPNAPLLNPSHLHRFFTQYEYDANTHSLTSQTGLIEQHLKQHPGKPLQVILTRDLNEHQWAMLLSQCKKHGVTLAVTNSTGNDHHLCLVTKEWQTQSHTTIIESTDPDTSIEQAKKDRAYRIIDVSELSSADLLVKRTGKYDSEQQRFIFDETDGVLLQAFTEEQNVILKGHFSSEVCDALAPLLIQRSLDPNLKTDLILVSDGPSALGYMPYQSQHITADDKKNALSKQGIRAQEYNQLTDKHFESEPLCTLKARCSYLQQHPQHNSANSDDAWVGVYSLPETIAMADYDLENSEAITQAFKANRLCQVNAVLKHSPFVLLTGLTGVGKTTFVQQELVPDAKGLYEGVSALKQWAQDKTTGRKILFIDEANITTRNWSEFEGLFNNPPSIVIDGIYYELTPEHKVVFAANPLNYGAARTLPSFFKRHGNAVLFKPMPAEMLFQTQLKPIMEGSFNHEQQAKLALIFLNVYRDVCAYSNDKILISPREVQMMALLTLAYCKQRRTADPEKVAQHYAYKVASALVPATYRRAFDEKHKPQERLARYKIKSTSQNNYVLTSSRRAITHSLNDLLNVRLLRWQTPALKGFPGLGGMLLEGKPGVGKSELVFNVLHSKGYVEASQASTGSTSKKTYYVIPASMQLSEKSSTLLKAFDEGAVVVMDEFNSASMMESLLNALLNGKTPGGKLPNKVGFTLIGTQNPASMAGRAKQSDALSCRLMTLQVPEYTKKEVKQVLAGKLLDPLDQKAARKAYVDLVSGNSKTATSFREFLKIPAYSSVTGGVNQEITY